MPELTAKTPILAEMLSLSARRIQQLVAAGVLPKPTAKGHDLQTAVRAYIRFLQQPARSASLTEAKQKLVEVQTALKEVELGHRRGELVEVSRCAAIWARAAAAIRARLLALPTKMAPMVVGKPVRETSEVLRRQVHEVLTELSQLKVDDVPDGDA